MPFQIALLYDKMLKGMPLNIISYKKAIWKGIEGHLKGIVQKLEDSRKTYTNHLQSLSRIICWGAKYGLMISSVYLERENFQNIFSSSLQG